MPLNKDPIEGKIAGVVTKKNVVINRGAKHGVKEGMRFSVSLKIGTITDPDDPTNIMEGLSFEKAKLKVTTVYDRMSYCAIIEAPINPSRPTSNPFSVLLQSRSPEIGEEAMVSDNDWKLHRADPVQEIVEDDKKNKD